MTCTEPIPGAPGGGIEALSLGDGFRVALLGVETDRGAGLIRLEATLMDGGRDVRSTAREGGLYAPSPAFFDEVRRVALAVLAPPHVLAAYGRGWGELLAMALEPAALAQMRVLDLRRTAIVLAPGTRPSEGLDALLQAYGVASRVPVEGDGSSHAAWSALLWAVVHRAAALGLDWPGLLRAARDWHAPVPFDGYAFSRETIDALPAVPAVYVMRDAAGQAFYVGQSGNLARRMGEYFDASREVPAKLRAIRERIRSFDYHAMGSELEALLWEARLIREFTPSLNVQRHVAEGAGRYGAPLLPVAMLVPSTQPGATEVFLLGGEGGAAVQVRVLRARPARRALEAGILRVRGARASRGLAGATDWGAIGAEIGHRYFGRSRDRLHWLELPAGEAAPALAERLVELVRRIGVLAIEPGEFRLG